MSLVWPTTPDAILAYQAFAEYFLIGTLASAALAIGCGFLLRLIFAALW